MPLKILGALPEPLDSVIRGVLHGALDPRPHDFVVHISRLHGDLTVHVRQPFDRRLKFNCPTDLEAARELTATLTEILDEECGPLGRS